MGRYLLLLFTLMALALPFWRYHRTRLADESLFVAWSLMLWGLLWVGTP